MREESRLLQKYATVLPHLPERQRRLGAAADAQMLGYGGIARVARASGPNRSTLHRGLKDLTGPVLPAERVRQVGGGRKRVKGQTPALMQGLEQLVAPLTRGDPLAPRRWTWKSTRHLARPLTARGSAVSYRVVAELVRE
jgi:Rhodopirellula transposase DDE domain